MANKNYEMVVSLNKSEFDALNKFKPSYKRGTEEGSYTWCKRQVGYAFCGGKENYTKAKRIYEKGCVLFDVKYGELLSNADFPTDKPTEEKPTSTSRGKNKGAKISENDEELFKQFLAFKKMLENNK